MPAAPRVRKVGQDGYVSFDLYAFPPSGPKTLDEVHHLLDAEELRLQGPWSGWPLWQPMEGGGTGLSIRWSQAEAMWSAIVDLTRSANIIIYDPRVAPHGGKRRRTLGRVQHLGQLEAEVLIQRYAFRLRRLQVGGHACLVATR
jgi:hypothetical protein